MFQVSKIKSLGALALVLLFMMGVVFLVTPTRADALTRESSAPVSRYVSYEGVLSLQSQPQTQPALPVGRVSGITDWLNEAACDLAPGIGAALSATTGVCDDTVVGSIVSGITDSLDCAKDPMGCVTQWLFKLFGSGVAWAANGVVHAVTGITNGTPCAPGNGGTGSGASGSESWTAERDAACSAHVNSDYFTTTELSAVDKAIADQNQAEITRLNKELAAAQKASPKDDAKIKQIQDSLHALGSINPGNTTKEDAVNMKKENSTFDIPKSAISSTAWKREYLKYATIGIALLVPMLIAGAIQSVISGKAMVMMRSVAIHLPLAIVGMIAAPWFIKTLMSLTDSFSAYIISDVGSDVNNFFAQASDNYASMTITMLLPFGLIAIIFLFASLLIWFILSMREASVAIIGVFMPIAFAASVWPALGKWAVRAMKLIVAAIISKVFIVGAISLGIGVFTTGVNQGQLSFMRLVFGATIFFIAAFSPHLVMKFFDEIGESLAAAGSTGAVSRGLSVTGNMNGTRALLTGGRMGGGGGGGLGAGGLSSMATDSSSRAIKAGTNAGSNARALGRPIGDVGDAAATASRATPESTGADDARAASSSVRDVPGATGGHRVEAAARAGMARARAEMPGATGDQLAQRAGEHVAEGAVAEGANPQQAAALARASTDYLGGNAGAQDAAAAHATSYAQANYTPPPKKRVKLSKVAAGVAFPIVGIPMAAKWGVDKARHSA